jgi:hypothetical protein
MEDETPSPSPHFSLGDFLPTGKNSFHSGPQTGQSPRRSPFTNQIDIPTCDKHDLFSHNRKNEESVSITLYLHICYASLSYLYTMSRGLYINHLLACFKLLFGFLYLPTTPFHIADFPQSAIECQGM